jgi:hypothetical protein
VLDKEVHVDWETADGLFQSPRVLFTFLEALTREFPKEDSVLSRVSGLSDAEIDIEGGWTRQAASLGEVTTKVFGHKAADEHEMVSPRAECGPSR